MVRAAVGEDPGKASEDDGHDGTVGGTAAVLSCTRLHRLTPRRAVVFRTLQTQLIQRTTRHRCHYVPPNAALLHRRSPGQLLPPVSGQSTQETAHMTAWLHREVSGTGQVQAQLGGGFRGLVGTCHHISLSRDHCDHGPSVAFHQRNQGAGIGDFPVHGPVHGLASLITLSPCHPYITGLLPPRSCPSISSPVPIPFPKYPLLRHTSYLKRHLRSTPLASSHASPLNVSLHNTPPPYPPRAQSPNSTPYI